MGKFLYEAKNEYGQLVKGEVQAENESVAEKLLLKNKLIVTELEPEKSSLDALNILNKVGVRERAQFARQLATMIEAGLPLVQSLGIILLQTKNNKFHTIIATIIRDVESGYSFSTAMAKHPDAFNRVFVSIVRSGEATGKLDEVLLELADQLEKDYSFSAKLKGALAYPAFIISAMIGVGTLMMIKVIPTIKSVFDEANAELPWSTRALMATSDFLVHFWYIALFGTLFLIVGVRFFLITEQGKLFLDKMTVKAPVISATGVSVLMARLTRTLGLLVGAGIPILEALRITSEVINNRIFQAGLDEVRMQVERGVPMSVPLMKNTDFPVLFGQMVSVGEQIGRIDSMLANLAHFYTEEAETRLKGLSTLIEPVVMVILGIGVAVLIFAILVPIYNISSIGA